MSWLSILSSFGAAILVSALATPIVSRFARAHAFVDRPNERKVNRRANIPLLGGFAVALGCFVGLFVGASLEPGFAARTHLEGLFLGGVVLLATGALDDKRVLSARAKLGAQLLAASVAMAYGYEIDHVTEPFTGTKIGFPTWLSWALTALWIVGVTNAINLIDGLDGLATGVSAIIGATLTLVCWQLGLSVGALTGIALMGGLLGFLPYNFWPARIFLGDTGALFIGYALALLALEGYAQAELLTFVVPLLALAVPIMDTLLSIVRRLRRRVGVFSPDRQHIHHRLLEAEGSQRSAVLSIYFLTACFCVIALSFTKLQGIAALLFLVAVLALTWRLVRNLGLFDAAASEVPRVGDSAEAGRGGPA